MKTIKLDALMSQDISGCVWAMQTDTIMGLCCLASDMNALKKLRSIKNRPQGKSLIILINEIDDLAFFNIELEERHKKILDKLWPGPVSVAFGQSNAYRIPDSKEIADFCREHGWMVATSLNISGQEPCKTLEKAYEVFGDDIDYYVESGVEPATDPSTVIKIIR